MGGPRLAATDAPKPQEPLAVNHYERLKVSPEAPPEVIRAAYRALAAKLHPDRKTGDSGPGDPLHDDMAALNASYLVLMDANGRAEYDRALAAQAQTQAAKTDAGPESIWGRWRTRSDEPATEPGGVGQAAEGDAADTRVNVDWLTAVPEVIVPWYKQPNVVTGILVAAALTMGALIWWGSHQAEQLEFDRSLSAGAERPAVDTPPLPSPALPGASKPELTPEQLARMSDSELLAAMPTLLEGPKVVVGSDGKPGAASAPPPVAAVAAVAALPGGMAAAGAHPLDGTPLGLQMAPMQLGARRP